MKYGTSRGLSASLSYHVPSLFSFAVFFSLFPCITLEFLLIMPAVASLYPTSISISIFIQPPVLSVVLVQTLKREICLALGISSVPARLSVRNKVLGFFKQPNVRAGQFALEEDILLPWLLQCKKQRALH